MRGSRPNTVTAGAMKSDSPAPKGRTSPAPQILAAAGRLARDVGRMGGPLCGRRSRSVPRRPRHKSANRATEGPTAKPYGWPPKATVRHHRRRKCLVDCRPDALIGCRIPEDVVVLDIDPRHDGLDTWDTIVAGHDLPVTRCHASGRNDGGFHIWFQEPERSRTQGP